MYVCIYSCRYLFTNVYMYIYIHVYHYKYSLVRGQPTELDEKEMW